MREGGGIRTDTANRTTNRIPHAFPSARNRIAHAATQTRCSPFSIALGQRIRSLRHSALHALRRSTSRGVQIIHRSRRRLANIICDVLDWLADACGELIEPFAGDSCYAVDGGV